MYGSPSTLSPPFPSTSSSPHSSFISSTSSCTSSTTLRGMDSLDGSYLLTGYEPKRLRPQGDLCRVLHRVPDQPTVLQARVPRGRTMTPHSRICFAKHTEYMSITPSEKACLSVSRRRPCPSERGDLLESERSDLLDQFVRS